ncbi:large proline-rich protein BAG6 [Panicum miliaceum]|uniref:Large proline-rich protein BAG6 n=1 Tax=Panicum miliaceum TaxID=4540 RepID=A0A3L6PQP8_PANMI|nr:large proline-rich protein BAG6 [Panicum miliaceum]
MRSVMEGLQSPAVVDAISNIVQNVDEQDLGAMFGSARGQGGMDLSRMLQQMMPVVYTKFLVEQGPILLVEIMGNLDNSLGQVTLQEDSSSLGISSALSLRLPLRLMAKN